MVFRYSRCCIPEYALYWRTEAEICNNLSGDHVYKLNYSMMLDFHKNNADATISAIEVPLKRRTDTASFMQPTRAKYTVSRKNHLSRKAILHQWAFTYSIWTSWKNAWLKTITMTSRTMTSEKMSSRNSLRMARTPWAYTFSGYWRDVGTIQAYYESNMDLITPRSPVQPVWSELENLYSKPDKTGTLYRRKRVCVEIDNCRGLHDFRQG